MAPPQQQEALFQKGRVDLGVQAYKLGQITTLRGVKKIYDVSQKTVKRRISGIKPKRGSAAPNCRLIPLQEESLKQWILSMDQRGMPPRIATVRQMASILATQCARRLQQRQQPSDRDEHHASAAYANRQNIQHIRAQDVRQLYSR